MLELLTRAASRVVPPAPFEGQVCEVRWGAVDAPRCGAAVVSRVVFRDGGGLAVQRFACAGCVSRLRESGRLLDGWDY